MNGTQTKVIGKVADVTIYEVAGDPKSFLYKSGLAINADGAPNAYGPADTEPLDYLANAGGPGNWWGIATDPTGKPHVQKIYHKQPGYYVSTTAHVNPAFPETNPDRYIDSSTVPFFVLPGGKPFGAVLGDIGLLFNTKTGDNIYAIYADIGPASKIGEASIQAAQALGVNSDPKKGGTIQPIIITLVFPGSCPGFKTPDVWFNLAHQIFQKWGGLARLQNIIASLY